ncbi:carboxypeptidase-like regulatory domain-containing protein [Actinosynnema sp. NPDC049800]
MTLSKRVVARRSLAFVAALAVTATLSAAARAQDPGTSPAAAEPVLTTSSPEAPPVQAQPATAQPTGAQQAAAPAASSPTAAAAKLAISATVGAGPFLVGEQIPVEVTLSNTGDADATGVKADGYSSSGSTFFIQSSEWGDLALSGPGVILPAGRQRVLTVRGEVQGWSGAPVAKFSIWQGNASVTEVELPLPVRDPSSAADTLAGLVYGDRNDNGAPDAGEALQGVRVTATTNGPPWTRLEATTGADGRFRFADLPVQVYGLYTDNAPDGWVIEQPNSSVAVDGSGSAANLLLRGQRPLTDYLSAAMRFTQDVYRVGDRAEVAVTLTNIGTADLTGIKADCQRANDGGPELRDLTFGDLALGGPGVTVPVGQSRAFTISGTVSEVAAEYGAADHLCEFGPGDGRREGLPRAYAVAKVPGPAVTLRMAFFEDRDGDGIGETGRMLTGAAIILRDAVTGEVAAQARTDAQGRVRFENLPSGPYKVRVYGAWKQGGYDAVVFAGTCRSCQEELWTGAVPAPDVTNTRRTGG